MKIALVTTTINNIPTVLRLYHKYVFSDVRFFVAGDQKTPHGQLDLLLDELGNHGGYLAPKDQESWLCSEPIGWNCIQRRNIATLEALRWGADIVVSIDDDNIPMGSDYFADVAFYLNSPYGGHSGLCVSSYSHWFDPGQLLIPPVRQRGFPLDTPAMFRVDPIVKAKVGVIQGTIFGDPDVDSITRLQNQHKPVDIHCASELLRSGVVVRPDTFTVFNSQNTAILRELVPAFFMIPHVGRFDDIFASLILHRVMRDRNLYRFYGPPFCWQQRNPHQIMKDFADEQLGFARVEEFARFVDRLPYPSEPLIPFLRQVFGELYRLDWWPPRASHAAFAWLDDCERVMA